MISTSQHTRISNCIFRIKVSTVVYYFCKNRSNDNIWFIDHVEKATGYQNKSHFKELNRRHSHKYHIGNYLSHYAHTFSHKIQPID